MNKKLGLLVGAAVMAMGSQAAMATCKDIAPSWAAFQAQVAAAAADDTWGYGLPMWATAVDETGMVCFVATSGSEDDDPFVAGAEGAYDWNNSAASGAATSKQQWLGSRVISAQKANTANAFSRNAYSIATGNLHNAVTPGGSLYGLQHSNPVDASRAYGGSPNTYGTQSDFLKNKRIGGVNVFGGGLALYKGGEKVGAIGVSGDTSCRDHAFAWEIRKNLGLDETIYGITNYNATSNSTAPSSLTNASNTATGANLKGDELIIDLTNDATGDAGLADNVGVLNVAGYAYWKGWSQPSCPLTSPSHESYIFIREAAVPAP